MVSLVINSLSPCLGTNYTAAGGGDRPAQAVSDKPDAVRADAQAIGRRSGIGAEDKAGQAQTKDGAGGGPAEECSDVRAGTRHATAQDRGVPDSDARTE